MQTRDRIHRLVDKLADRELPAVEQFLEKLQTPGDPFLSTIAHAPEDDEPLTPEEAEAIQEGRDAISRGEVVSTADLRRALGPKKVSTGGSPLRRALVNAPVQDEPLTPEEVAALDEGYEDIAAGRTVSDDDLWRRLGHTPTRSPAT